MQYACSAVQCVCSAVCVQCSVCEVQCVQCSVCACSAVCVKCSVCSAVVCVVHWCGGMLHGRNGLWVLQSFTHSLAHSHTYSLIHFCTLTLIFLCDYLISYSCNTHSLTYSLTVLLLCVLYRIAEFAAREGDDGCRNRFTGIRKKCNSKGIFTHMHTHTYTHASLHYTTLHFTSDVLFK